MTVQPRPRALATIIATSIFASASVGQTESSLGSSTDEIRALVSEMLVDAESRSSLLQSGAVAGHDGHFFLASPDGSFRLETRGQIQFRYIVNFRGDDGVNDDFETGFQTPRTRLVFTGHVFNPNWFYRIQGGFNRAGGAFRLEDAFFGYKFDNGFTLRAGQFITAFLREWNMGDWTLLSVERSNQALVFGQNRSQAVELKYVGEQWRAMLTFSDGHRSLNTDLGADPADFAFTGRVEALLGGDWGKFASSYTSPHGSDLGAVIGAAVHFEQGPDLNIPGIDEQSLFAWTVDALIKGDGWHLMIAGVGHHVTDEAGVTGADFDDFGFLAQASYLIAEDIELFSRYDIIIPDSGRAANDSFSAITLGFNYFIHGQAARFTLQVQWFLDPTTATAAGNFANTGARSPANTLFGVLPSADDNQVTLSAQFQLLF